MKTKQWKSYAELAETQEYAQWVDDEFPGRATLLDLDRRDFLKLTGAGMALAGLSGCRIMPHVKSVPYVRAPEQQVPGQSVYYATTLESRGLGIGVLVRSYEGRPVKIEGNPEHPSSLGATDAWTQSELLSLYDPERAQSVVERGEIRNWDQFFATARPLLKKEAGSGGAGIRLVTSTIVSPTYAAQIGKFLSKYPSAKWIQWEPLSQSNVRQGTQLVFGKPLSPVYHLEAAKTVLSVDADFLLTLPGAVRYAREFANGRRVREGSTEMNRLYTIESSYSITGASSDHRLALKPTDIERFVRALYAKVTGAGAAPLPAGVDEAFISALADDLKAGGVVIPGDEQTPGVHAIAHALNAAIGAIGKGVTYHAPIEAKVQDSLVELKQLASDLAEGKVTFLLTLGGNPVYDAPAELKLRELYLSEKCPLRAHLGRYADETAEVSHWFLPESHGLESWGDLKAHDGTIGLQQPLVEPLYETKTASEVLTLLVDQPFGGMELLRQHYASLSENVWRKAVHDGVIANSASPAVAVTAAANLLATLPEPPASAELEVNFRPDPTIWDGRYATNTWLQELPKPLTTIVWDNAALISPKTAKKLGLISDEHQNDAVNIAQYSGKKLIEVSLGEAKIKVAAWVQPGQPDDTITLYLGYGRTQGGPICEKQGFNVYPLRTSASLNHATGVTVKATNEDYSLAYTQPHHLMRSEVDNAAAEALHINEHENRDIVRSGSLKRFIDTKGRMHEEHHPEPERAGEAPHEEHGEEHTVDAASLPTIPADDAFGLGRNHWKYVAEEPTVKTEVNKEGLISLYPEYSRAGFNAWAMSIDLTTCIGCNACTIACQAENNIPVVGKDQVAAGREMHWIRIDHYFESPDLVNVESHFMPIPCMQCEKAPCEPVCPVAATVHSHEGLNQMVYNRCVGTRYCSNNCPYKVRRFNFLKWTQGAGGPTTLNFFEKPVLKMLPNPDVTLRGRGVMEKCTYCVQRINEVRIEAKKESREIQDGEIITACQQVCPTQAIVFGDINNPKSKVSLLKKQPHDYSLLAELNTRPRTTYLAKIKNPNPALVKPGAESAAEGGH
ncbi:TAT-variant-translocated molybdopterin oxidoreductase [Armatimonas rosea]|uniref:Molybdopterin-containing oxidoreductase family iron-sulfur binding subunit n=1 Tax=Armatimonas rosea TaxID=685828 RepID=A0A7W9SRE9_ARMRO|nr:TAT-variant-translocated molybdopterin oxidoreductase [Armatimonas rosea]MBB6051070.1 molybdopterin-containing oxidoreductase family iron-sulfur binding subunit [Armatimonas rosea]